jgi:hypothetical protein
VTSFALVAGLLLERRAIGALETPLPALALWSTGALACLAALAARSETTSLVANTARRQWSWPFASTKLKNVMAKPSPRMGEGGSRSEPGEGFHSEKRPHTAFGHLLPEGEGLFSPFSSKRWPTIAALIGTVCVGLSLTLPTSSWQELLVFWVLILGAITTLFWPLEKKIPISAAVVPPQVANPREEEEHEAAVTENWSQRLTRYRSAEGHDTLTGEVRCEFAAGERSSTIHIAFCPAFATLPSFDFEPIDDSNDSPSPGAPHSAEVRILLGQLLPQGARLDLKLAAPGPATVVVAISAVAREHHE